MPPQNPRYRKYAAGENLTTRHVDHIIEDMQHDFWKNSIGMAQTLVGGGLTCSVFACLNKICFSYDNAHDAHRFARRSAFFVFKQCGSPHFAVLARLVAVCRAGGTGKNHDGFITIQGGTAHG